MSLSIEDAQFLPKLLADPHPPLYPLLLKGWMAAFGHAETVTRGLSLLSALLAMTSLIYGLGRRSLPVLIVAVLLFGSSWLFPSYAQETRNYSLLLLLTTLATLLFLSRDSIGSIRRRYLWYSILFALSLTHFLGLVYAGILLFWDLARTRQPNEIVERIILGALMLGWPMIHILGGLSISSEGAFVASDRLGQTVYMATESLLSPAVYALESVFGLPARTSGYVAAACVIGLLLLAGIAERDSVYRKHMGWLFVIIGSFVATLALVDRLPIWHGRYYLVLLPPAVILLAHIFNALWHAWSATWQRISLALVLFAYTAGSLYQSVDFMIDRWTPAENWKGLAEALRETKLCAQSCWFAGEPKRVFHYEYYFADAMGSDPEAVVKSVPELIALEPRQRRPIIAAHVGSPKRDQLFRAYPGWRCLEPKQSRPARVYLLVDATMPKSAALAPCSVSPR